MDKDRNREILARLLAGQRVEQVFADYQASNLSLVDFCLTRGVADEDALRIAISEHYKLPVVDRKPRKISLDAARMIGGNAARLHHLIPIELKCGLVVACEDPISLPVEAIELMTVGWHPRPVIATRTWIRQAQDFAYGPAAKMTPARPDAAWRADQRIDGWYADSSALPARPSGGNLTIIAGGLPANAPDVAPSVKLVVVPRNDDE